MKRHSGFISFALFLACAGRVAGQAASPAATEPSFTMKISLRDENVKPGSEIMVNVELTNTSASEIALVRIYTGPPPYTVYVFDREGKEAPSAPFGSALRKGETAMRQNGKVRNFGAASGGPVRIAPGKTAKDGVTIERMFEFAPGTYTVRLERVDPYTKLLVKSNTVTLTVTN
jgi:hypothetical protein